MGTPKVLEIVTTPVGATETITFTADDEGGVSIVGESTGWASFKLYDRNVN